MSSYTATISWSRDGASFTDNRFSRRHTWTFDGGIELPASASPQVVPPPLSALDAVDPEEAFVASLSSCHMLWFLSITAKKGFVVDSYRDEASGVLSKDSDGKLAMTLVTLRPRVVFAGDGPSQEEFESLHHQAHERCFIANSVKTEVRCEAESVVA